MEYKKVDLQDVDALKYTPKLVLLLNRFLTEVELGIIKLSTGFLMMYTCTFIMLSWIIKELKADEISTF